MKPLIVILYDSITNSVFESQVLQPIIKKRVRNPALNIHIISFENNTKIKKPHIDGITFHLFKRHPFMHHMQLYKDTYKVRSLIKKLNYDTYTLLARGPFAGCIAQRVTKSHPILIQARGLMAEEYRYVNTRHKKLSILQQLRYKQFKTLEHYVYSSKQKNIHIEAVSPALKDYLMHAFHIDRQNITIAHNDIPNKMPQSEKEKHRTAIRAQLHIKNNQTVYCYNGSFKPWQCPEQTITYFQHAYKKDTNAFLLILTPDMQAFKQMIATTSLPQHAYTILSIAPQELNHYLATADIGMLFREKDVINKVSRPTKILDYRAAGLQIVHNNTVDYLMQC